MTTAAEVKQALVAYPADAQRLVFAPSSLLGTEQGQEQLARDIVALANRDGGRVVLGVDAAGRYESALAMNDEQAHAACEEMLARFTAPRVDAHLEHLVGEDGDLLVVGVQRRSGSPHAVARTNAKGSVGSRLYCVRHHDRTVPVSDVQLRWLFSRSGDGAATRAVEFTLHARRGTSGLRTDILQPRVTDAIEAVLAGLPAETTAEIVGNPEALQQAAVELTSWVFLDELADVLGSGSCDLEVAEQQLEELPVPMSGSVFSGLPAGLRGLLGGPSPGGVMSRILRRGSSRSFVLPVGAEVQVDYLARLGKARVGVHSRDLRVGFSAVAGEVGSGVRWPGLELPDDDTAAWVSVRGELQVELPFPASNSGDNMAPERLATVLAERLAARWDDATLHAAVSPAAVERLFTG